jgi:hypothetical protein
MTPDRPPPHVAAWRDQLGALLRDKCRLMQEAAVLTDWGHIDHDFVDPYDGDAYRLAYRDGRYWVVNLTRDIDYAIELDLEALGVNRR